MSEAQKAAAITQIANTSRLLRDAISASLPVAPEQYLCIAIPGTVIDTRDISNGGTYVYEAEYSAFPPTQVAQAEAKLVDNMVPLANVMLGNTGKSVSRSYSRALDSLVPRKATISSGPNQVRSPGEKSYDDAMKYLTSIIDPATSSTPVDIYVIKQKAWADEQEKWDRAKLRAKQAAQDEYPTDIVAQRQSYDDWNQANYRKFKYAVQGRWMDWVTNGHKYDVEYNFAIVDIDSIMAMIENSKESLRNSTIVDFDGANEVHLVNLTPKNWATLCAEKAAGWYTINGDYSLPQIDGEIGRLQRLLVSYQNLQTAVQDKTYPEKPPGTAPPDPTAISATLSPFFKDLYDTQALFNEQITILTGKPDDEKKTYKQDPAYTGAEDALKTAQRALSDAVEVDKKANVDWTKYELVAREGDQQNALANWIAGQITILENQIASLQAKRREKVISSGVTVPAIEGAHNQEKDANGNGSGTDIAPNDSVYADPIFGLNTNAALTSTSGGTTGAELPVSGSPSDPWTAITASFSASDQQTTSSTSSWGFSVGGSVGWGLWSVGGSYSHEQSSSDYSSEMANCDVSIAFKALVVNIGRPWLYGEIFSDFEVDVASGVMLSPGAQDLQNMIAAQKSVDNDPLKSNPNVISQLAQYDQFPAYPTSFIVAADTTIEFNGDTQKIEQHFSAQSNAGSVSVGYGPWSVSSSFHQSSSNSSFSMTSTATGCKLSFGAPQVIGWVCQILPALPRQPGFVPMIQNIYSG